MEGKLAHGKKLNVIRCREMQVKNHKYIIAYLPEWLLLKKNNNVISKCWQEYRETGLLIHCWLKCKIVRNIWKLICQFFFFNKCAKLSI